MIRFTIDKKKLASAVSRAGSIIEPKSPLPAAKCALLQGDSKILSVTGTGIISRVTERIECESEPFAIAIGARDLYEYLAVMPEGDVTVTIDGFAIELKSGKRKFKMTGIDADSFPSEPPRPDKQKAMRLNGKDLSDVMKTVMHSVNTTDSSRANIHGMLIEQDSNELRAVATDGATMSIARRDTGSGELSVFIPFRAIKPLVSIAETADAEPVSLAQSDRYVIVETEHSCHLFASGGEFVPYRMVIPGSHESSMKVSGRVFESAVRAVAAAADQASGNIKMTADPGGIKLSLASSKATASDEIDSEVSGTFSATLSARGLADTLKAAGDNVTIEGSGPLDPIVIKSPGAESWRYFGIVMPIRE